MTPSIPPRKTYSDIKLGVLHHLRVAWYQGAPTNEKTPINPWFVALDLGVDPKEVEGAILELARLQLVRAIPHSPSDHVALVTGQCEITTMGLAHLHEIESGYAVPPLAIDPGT